MDAFQIVPAFVVGVSIFVAGQIIQRLWIEPLQEFNKTRGRIAHALTLQPANIYRFQTEDGVVEPDLAELTRVTGEIRRLAAELRANHAMIPLYRPAAFCLRLPSKKDIIIAASRLEVWASSIYGNYPGGSELQRDINRHLKLGLEFYDDHSAFEAKKRWGLTDRLFFEGHRMVERIVAASHAKR